MGPARGGGWAEEEEEEEEWRGRGSGLVSGWFGLWRSDGGGGSAGAMQMGALPAAAVALGPDAGFLCLPGARGSVLVDELRESDVGDAGGVVSDEVNVGVEQSGVGGLGVATGGGLVVEVELVELHALDQIPQRLWLETRHPRIAELPASLLFAIHTNDVLCGSQSEAYT